VILDDSDVLQIATNTINTSTISDSMFAFGISLSIIDSRAKDFWSKAHESADDLAKTTNKYVDITINGIRDSAAVNSELSEAVLAIEQVIPEWSDLIGGLDSVVKIALNDASIAGLKDVAKTISEKWDAAFAPLQQVSEKLVEVKQDLQRGSQPWTSNVDTDKPLQEALDMLDQVSSDVAETKTQPVVDWFHLVHDTAVEKCDGASEVLKSIDPMPDTAKMLLHDLAGGLVAWVAKFEEELRKIKAITAKAVAAEARSPSVAVGALAEARSSAEGPFRPSVVVGALALIALAPAM